MIRPRRKKLLGALYGVLAVAIAGECMVRLLEHSLIQGNVGALSSFIVLRDDFWTLRPNTTVVQPERYGDIRYSSNMNGFRDRNHPPDSDACRIVFLGDSITFGLEVQQDRIYPRILETMLNRNARRTCEFETVNLAGYGYSPMNELAVLKEYGMAYRPKLIFLQLYMNDFSYPKRPERSRALRLRLAAGKNQLTNRSALYRRLRQAFKAASFKMFHELRRTHFPATLNVDEPKRIMTLFSGKRDYSDIEGFSAIEMIYRAARERNIKFLAVLTPHEGQLYSDEYDIINDRIRQFCEDRRIPFCDPLVEWRDSDDRARIINDGLHLSEAGHRKLAEFLAPLVLERISFGNAEEISL